MSRQLARSTRLCARYQGHTGGERQDFALQGHYDIAKKRMGTMCSGSIQVLRQGGLAQKEKSMEMGATQYRL